MNRFLTQLNKKFPPVDREKWITTINLAKIETSNLALNKVPDDCTVWIDIRYVPGDTKTILGKIRKLVPMKFTVDILEKEPAMLVGDNKYIRLLRQISQKVLMKKILVRGANGTSDARHFAKLKCPGIEFGPIGGDIGGDDEWVDIPSLKKYQKIVKEFLMNI